MNCHFSAFLATSTLLVLAGCASPGPLASQNTTKYTVENTEKFVLLDQQTQDYVTCTGLQERTLTDGRIEVVANVKNRENRRVQVQIQCVFKDEQMTSKNADAPWQTLILTENSTEAVRFTASTTLAKRYTIRVRQAR